MRSVLTVATALVAVITLTVGAVGAWTLGALDQQQRDRECVQTDALWSDVMACIDGRGR